LDEGFTRLYKILVVKKLNPVHVEVIIGRPLSFGDVTHETILLEVNFGNHNNSIVFNIIRIPSAPIILGLSWLERSNPQRDWKSRNIEFLVIPALIERISKPSSTKKPPFIKPLFITARVFMRVARMGTSFAIYTTPTSEEIIIATNIPAQYKEFQDIFEEKKCGHLTRALTIQLCH
jgi:hypothetical protein